MKKVAVIGSGFAGLAAAALLAKEGCDVTVFEKNATPGGRARKFEANGFTFDMGPSWYWMPDVFENFFQQFGKSASDYYHLTRLDPSYRVYFGKEDYFDIPAGIEAVARLFETLEPGSSKQLIKFIREGEHKYAVGMRKLVYKPGLSVREFFDIELIRGVLKLHVLQSLSHYVRKSFRHPRIIQLLEFPVLFLGAAPDRMPALYSLMNYADMALGTWYPVGGMHRIVDAMINIATENGARFRYNSTVTSLEIKDRSARGVWCHGNFFAADYVVAAADYHHVEHDLLPESSRTHSTRYWNSKIMAPSCLIFYLGLNRRIQNVLHHTLFFDVDFQTHAREIYDDPRWPTAPRFYVSCASRTDQGVAPAGCENLFILIPVASALKDDERTREKYFDMVMDRLERLTGQSIKAHVVYKRSYAHRDFIEDYNSFKGNAYGLANTLRQTANFKPGIVTKKIINLFYTGQLTVPGPGVPPAIISGLVVAKTLLKNLP